MDIKKTAKMKETISEINRQIKRLEIGLKNQRKAKNYIVVFEFEKMLRNLKARKKRIENK